MLRYAERYLSDGRFFILKLLVGFVLLLRLPLVVGASLWPLEKTKRVWKGAWRAYLQLLVELVHPVGVRC